MLTMRLQTLDGAPRADEYETRHTAYAQPVALVPVTQPILVSDSAPMRTPGKATGAAGITVNAPKVPETRTAAPVRPTPAPAPRRAPRAPIQPSAPRSVGGPLMDTPSAIGVLPALERRAPNVTVGLLLIAALALIFYLGADE